MVAPGLLSALGCLGVLLNFLPVESELSASRGDILLNGSSDPVPASGTNPLLAHVHINNFKKGTHLVQQLAAASAAETVASPHKNQDHVQEKQQAFSALQTSLQEEPECSCTFAGMCLYKGACLWIAASLSFAVILFLFLTAWALQWVVAIPAEWVLPKKQFTESISSRKAPSTIANENAPLLGN